MTGTQYVREYLQNEWHAFAEPYITGSVAHVAWGYKRGATSHVLKNAHQISVSARTETDNIKTKDTGK
jgi:hypothetical protein